MDEIYDAHLHMGFLKDNMIVYPSDVKKFISRYSVKGGAIMPTASVSGNDDFELHKKLYAMALEEGFDIILYVTPPIIDSIRAKNYVDLEGLYFVAIKIHPDAYDYNENQLQDVVEFSQVLDLPLYIHTGGKSSCYSSRFERIIKKNKNQVFVLCHARPANEAFQLLEKYSNVWIDTSFLDSEDLVRFISDKNCHRILFGSDFPANLWFPSLGKTREWYAEQLDFIQRNLTSYESSLLLSCNYSKFKKIGRSSIES